MKTFFLKSFLLIILLLPLALASEEITPTVREYQLKAMFLLNFTKFITWPVKTFPTATIPLSICVLGEDPFQGKLDFILQNNTTQSRSIEIHYFSTVDKAKICQVLFISDSEKGRLAEIYAILKGLPVLTVSDIKDSVRNGGMIEFYVKESKVRFFVDPQTVKEAGLQVSSRLLQVANVVEGK